MHFQHNRSLSMQTHSYRDLQMCSSDTSPQTRCLGYKEEVLKKDQNQTSKNPKQLLRQTQKLASTLVCPANHCLPLAAPTLQYPSVNLQLVWDQPCEAMSSWASCSRANTRSFLCVPSIRIPPPFISSRNNLLPVSTLQLQTG